MTVEVEIGGEALTVAVEPVPGQPGRFRAMIGTRRLLLDARRLDASRISLLLLDGSGASHEVTILEHGPGDLAIGLREGTLRARVDGRRRRRGRVGGVELRGEQRIVAPMPGKVVRVAVAPGDVVAARQGLVVIEAMKMENELTSPKAGRVKEVAVREGMSVEAGRLLAIVE